MMTTVEIPATDEIALTDVRAGDKAAFVQHLADRGIYERTLRIPHPYTEADAEFFLGLVAEATGRHGEPVHFAIRHRDARLVGGLGFEDLQVGHRAEIGYWLAEPFRGRGIVTAAVQAACLHAFARWNLVRITAHVFSFNQSSARVLEKSGFAFEGLLRKHYLKDGQFHDCRLFARVR